MPNTLRKLSIVAFAVAALCLSPLATSHLDDKAMPESYRQSWFAMIGMNFGPIVDMLKGKSPWDEERMQFFANQMAALASMDVDMAFTSSTGNGKTRAKAEIWENKEDFAAKMKDMKAAVMGLQTAAASGDKAAIGEAVAATGGACKACHDDYKSKDYL